MALGFGIVGCGMIADFHARALASLPNAKVVGCASRSPQSARAFAKKHNCRFLATVEDLTGDPEVDVVSICSPSGAHLEPALLAARAGKHVVVEKPLEVTPARCDQIIEACEDSGVLLSTIFQSRFHESSRLLKSAVEAGRFGQIALANAYVKWHRSQEYYDSGAWRGTWELDGGGALMNQAIHNVDLLLWMMGPVEEVTAYTATLAHLRIEVEDAAVAILRFANGALGTIEATTSAFPGESKRLEIYGSSGSAAIVDEEIQNWHFAESLPDDQTIIDRLAAQNATDGGASDPASIGFAAHASQFQNVIDAIEGRDQLLVDGGEARKSVELIDAIYKSARERKPVKL
ncbi:MAG: Gfo/Idh/MocA family protein [Pirellulaceae bacterium]